jgi:hypothetical protein
MSLSGASLISPIIALPYASSPIATSISYCRSFSLNLPKKAHKQNWKIKNQKKKGRKKWEKA